MLDRNSRFLTVKFRKWSGSKMGSATAGPLTMVHSSRWPRAPSLDRQRVAAQGRDSASGMRYVRASPGGRQEDVMGAGGAGRGGDTGEMTGRRPGHGRRMLWAIVAF